MWAAPSQGPRSRNELKREKRKTAEHRYWPLLPVFGQSLTSHLHVSAFVPTSPYCIRSDHEPKQTISSLNCFSQVFAHSPEKSNIHWVAQNGHQLYHHVSSTQNSHLVKGTSTCKMLLPVWPAVQASGVFSWMMISVRGPAHSGWCHHTAGSPGY